MAIVKVQYADKHEWIDTDTGNTQSPDLWTPAIEVYSSNYKAWMRQGVYHREYDLPAITAIAGREEWWIRGYRYRLIANGPALMFNEPSGTIGPNEDEYWLWNIKYTATGERYAGWEDEIPPNWTTWEGYLSDAELGYDTDYPLPEEPPVEE